MNRMNFFKNIKFSRPSIMQIILIVVGILVAVGAFFFMRSLITCWTITPLPGEPPSNCGTVTAGQNGPELSDGTPVADVEDLPAPPVAIPDSNLPPAWDGASRINILLIGLDYRDLVANQGPPRSDTMIVFTIDP